MRITKQEYIKEAFYRKGQYNKLASVRNATSRRLKELAIEEGLLACIEERTVLKRALKGKRKKFKEDMPTHELVQLAIKSKIKLDNIWK